MEKYAVANDKLKEKKVTYSHYEQDEYGTESQPGVVVIDV